MQLERSAGILLHPTSLPGRHGVGDLGAEARRFVDALAVARQSWWQILPLNPPDFTGSPYASSSAFACNPTLIDLDQLVDEELLEGDELRGLERLAASSGDRYFDVARIADAKEQVLRKAFERFDGRDERFLAFREEESAWLGDFALFRALEARFDGAGWRRWPEPYVRRDPDALEQARDELAGPIRFAEFQQWIFHEQWTALREYAADRGVRIIGDIPIFVAMDSADVWANRKYFEVDARGEARVVAGVPPDYFSETGQKWGNPVFRWDELIADGYAWWGERIDRALELADLVRIDHFRGFEAHYEIPADSPTAEIGEWVDGPGADFFEWVRDSFGEIPIIAEDLGVITEEVEALRDRFELPGMKIMQFGFEGDLEHEFLPHNYPVQCVAYTGTHDNDTTQGWWDSMDEDVRDFTRDYLDLEDDEEIVERAIEALYESDCALAVLPAQDLWALPTEHRMNFPSTTGGTNWRWRMTDDELDDRDVWEWLGELARETDRL